MKFKDQFRFVTQNMKKNKTRVLMTILATSMGCAFLIVLASVGFGLHKSIIKEMTEDRLVTEIEVYGIQGEKKAVPITDKDIQFFETIEGIKAVTRRQTLQQSGVYKIDNYEIDAQTIVAHLPSEVKAGFELSSGRLPKQDHEIIVGYDFARNLADSKVDQEQLYDENGKIKEEYQFKGDILDKKVTLVVRQLLDEKEKTKKITLTIVGVGKKPAKQWFENRDVMVSEAVLKEIEQFTGTPKGMIVNPDQEEGEELLIEKDTYEQVKIYAPNVEAVEKISEKLTNNRYLNHSIVNQMKDINKIFFVIKVGLIFVGAIAILIASIGIYNTMTMAVTERSPDIGIMKAIGANPRTIRRVFLLESSYIGILGALIGTIISYGISKVVNFALPILVEMAFNEQPPENLLFSYIPLSLPIICFVICYLVTILSGYRPAKRATKVDVLKALRREI